MEIDNVIITNKFGIEFEVSRIQAWDYVKQGDISETDIREIWTDKIEVSEIDIYAEYKTKFGKEIPPNKKNDIEWIESKLLAN